jgi:serum/glucocorticoid-regulated kinase 2
MGNCNLRAEDESNAVSSKAKFLIPPGLNKTMFEHKYAIGRGGFGKVWRVSSTRLTGGSGTEFAMKEMLKARVMNKKSIQSVMNELKLLQLINSPFIVNAHYAFQDSEYLYLVMDLLLGGDLRYHLARKRKFSQEQTRFFCACII